ncbi:MAG: cytochrome c biogenesis CcdA family protein [Actinomycetota bacterium]|nr:cytochrome c biogenesis CcdA family protein [Actinomycetota bacterium]
MDGGIFFGGSLVAATVAGVIALFAPCCISVMLPAYFASSFQNRRVLVAMTFLFAAGIATVILPLAMGASVLRQLFTEQHTVIYVVGGLLMLALAAYTLLGGQLHLPMPGRRAGGKSGPLGVYSLGVFSGVASSCCAPVLAGVIALSSVASSFGLALGLGAAYVFGMVAPLFAVSLLWERYDWRSSRLFRPRTFTYRLGPVRRTIGGTGLASGLLLAVMGTATLYVGLAYDSMPAGSGWQARLSADLEHYGRAVTEALAWVPGWAAAVALLAVVALLAWRALGQMGPDAPADPSADPPTDTQETEEKHETKEETLEYRDA